MGDLRAAMCYDLSFATPSPAEITDARAQCPPGSIG